MLRLMEKSRLPPRSTISQFLLQLEKKLQNFSLDINSQNKADQGRSYYGAIIKRSCWRVLYLSVSQNNLVFLMI